MSTRAQSSLSTPARKKPITFNERLATETWPVYSSGKQMPNKLKMNSRPSFPRKLSRKATSHSAMAASSKGPVQLKPVSKLKPTESKGGSSHPIGKERESEDDITVSGGGIGQLQSANLESEEHHERVAAELPEANGKFTNFFMLRLQLFLNRQQATIDKEEGCCVIRFSRTATIKFDSIYNIVNDAVKKCGGDGIGNYRVHPVPVFELSLGSHEELHKLLSREGRLNEELQSQLQKTLGRISSESGEIATQITVQTQVLLFASRSTAGKYDPPTMETVDEEVVIFNFDTPYMLSLNGTPPTLKELNKELRTVVNWKEFGINLHVKDYELQTIENDYRSTKERRIHLLMVWLQITIVPTWGHIVQALSEIRENRVAKRIADRYGCIGPSVKEGEEDDRATSDRKMIELGKQIKMKDEQLERKEKQLQKSNAEKRDVEIKFEDLTKEAKHSSTNIKKYLQQKKEIKKILLMRQEQMEIIEEKNASLEVKNSSLKNIIEYQEREIKDFERNLREIQESLQQEKESIQSLQLKLNSTLADLSQKSSTIKKLTKEKSRLEQQLIREKERVQQMHEQNQDHYKKVLKAMQGMGKEKERIESDMKLVNSEIECREKDIDDINKMIEQQRQKLAGLGLSVSDTDFDAVANLSEELTESYNMLYQKLEQRDQCFQEREDLNFDGICLAYSVQDIEEKVLPNLHEINMQWREGHQFPAEMSHLQVLLVKNELYCGGGVHADVQKERQLLVYRNDRWLPVHAPCPNVRFGLTSLDGKVAAIGGERHTDSQGTPSEAVWVLEGERNHEKWADDTIPSLRTARIHPTVLCYQSSTLVACGGISHWTDNWNYTCTDSVEIYFDESEQWIPAQSMPVRNNAMSCTVIDNKCYLVGGGRSHNKRKILTNDAVCGDLLTLLEGAIKNTSTNAWTVLQGCPNRGSMAAKLGGALIVLGGKRGERSNDVVSSIYMYDQSKSNWELLTCRMNYARYLAVAAQLPNGDMLVIGGRGADIKNCRTTLIASIHGLY